MTKPRLALLALALALSACSKPAPGKVDLALNWKPEPEFGGIFEAERTGAFAKHGLDLSRTGGPGAPVVQMVAAGQARYGIASGDEVVLARSRGSDVVAIFATYQTSPVGLMTHAARGIESLQALLAAPGTLAVEPGSPYVKFLEKKFGFGALKVVPYGFSISPFLADSTFAQQVFVTSEPISAKRAGADPRVFLVADSGYNPYTAVVIAQGETVRSHRDEAARLVAALREGWGGYLADPAPANALMGKLNPEMDAEAFAQAAAAQQPLIETKGGALGRMSAERWTQLAEQLKALGLIEKAEPGASYFADLE